MSAYLRLAGGLGNQLFQMAALSIFADRHGMTPRIVVDGLNRYTVRRDPDGLRLLSSEWTNFVSEDHFSSFVVDRLRVGRWCPVLGISDRNFWHELRDSNASKIAILDGYFQRGWTLDTFSRAVRLLGTVTCRLKNEIDDEGVCAVHVRGGDFLKIPRHQVVDFQYYARAIRCAQKNGFTEFAVVTDDPVYAAKIMRSVKDQLSSVRWRFHAGSSDVLSDFCFINRSRGRVIGNSTFAWWAAALDENHSMTWAPSKFIRNEFRDFHLPWEIVVS